MAEKQGLERFKQYHDIFAGGLQALKSAPEPDEVKIAFFELGLGHVDGVIRAVENDEPLVSEWYGNAVEIYGAMDLVHFCPVDMILATLDMFDGIDQIHQCPTPDDSCGLIQLATDGVRRGIVPRPTVICSMLEPCDAQSVMHEAWGTNPGWDKIPVIALDPPYGNTDDDYRYFAGELRREIALLEKYTGHKMDWDKLARICDEMNRSYAAWDDFNHIIMQKPCTMPSFTPGNFGWNPVQHIGWPGDPKNTAFYELMSKTAMERLEKGQGIVPFEQVRVLWADLDGPWNVNVFGPWLEQTFGGVVVTSFQGRTPYSVVDTSSEESMLFGLARRSLTEVPMIRQARGTVDIFCQDIRDMVRDYQIDCVIFPGHKGHKDQGGNIAYLKETCREIGVPLLTFTSDIFDPTYLPMEQIKRIVTNFFETQGWYPLDKLGK